MRKSSYIFVFDLAHDAAPHELENWLLENIIGDYHNRIINGNHIVLVRDIRDAIALKLRWCDYIVEEMRDSNESPDFRSE
jgi:hypothetical protein